MPDQPDPEYLALQAALAGRYSLIRELGRGGMGIVYLARDVALDRPVAIKLLPPAMAADPELKERFLREARTAAQLSHPHIVPIHLVEAKDDLVYFVMAYVDGESLGDRIHRAGPLRAAEAVRIVQEVAWALAYAHGRGVVHRDIKPDNILLDKAAGRALVTDFGIARSTTAPALTSQGLILGTVQYMAPEHAAAGARLDGRADLYALGVTAFYALTGRLPFGAESAPALIAAHLLEPAPPVRSVAPAVPALVAEAVDRCLAKDPGARWPTGEALAEALTDTGAAARATPPSIRGLVHAVASGGTQIGLLLLVWVWVDFLVPEQRSTIGVLLLLVLIAPILAITMAARGVVIAGFNADDVADAFVAENLASDRYTEHQRNELQRAARQLRKWWGRLIAGLIGGAEVWTGALMLHDLLTGHNPYPLFGTLFTLFTLWAGVELAGFGLGIGPFRDRLPSALESTEGRKNRLLERLWRSAPVRWLLTLSSIGVKRASAPAVSRKPQPTEAILANAATDVFAGLSPQDRRALGGLPETVQKLEGVASRMRDRRAALERALADIGQSAGSAKREQVTGDLTKEKLRVEERLRVAVEALESLRLDLLKLRAGVGTTDDLTAAIEAARRIGEDVDIALHARAEAATVVA